MAPGKPGAMSVLILILMVAAFLLLLGAAFRVGSRRVELGWLGLASWALAVLLGMLPD
jgi:hypothetical protein